MTEPTADEQTVKSELIDDKKSVDKLEIEDEERKKMLDAPKNEDEKDLEKITSNGGDPKQARVAGGEVEKKKKALEEAAKAGGAGHRPIGGIKIPGFLRSTRKDRTKDGDEGEEKADLLVETPCSEKVNSPTSPAEKDKGESSGTFPFLSNLPLNNLRFSVPFLKRKRTQDQTDGTEEQTQQPESGEESTQRKPKLINAIRLPLASLVPKKLKSKDGDVEAGTQAGLASVETLDDPDGAKTHAQDDGMENIRLDSVEVDPEKAALEDESESKWAKEDWQKCWDVAKEHKLAVFGVSVFLILLIILIIAVITGPRVPTHAPVVDGKISAVTSCGFVEGLLEGEEFVFRGIPYARPPLGELRFHPPQPMRLEHCWNGTFQAHNVTPSCWQIFTNNTLDGSEDCLTLDVWTPYVRYDTPLPVLFLLGTDSLNGGWPSKLHVPPGLSKLKELVVVRPRFRLTTLGFLASMPLSQATYPRSSGNYGLADVIEALTWVQLNIQHFGGDPKSVTVLGYRAGATLGTLLTTLRRPERLFTRMWLSTPTTVFSNISLAESELTASGYLDAVGCGRGDDQARADCLRKADVEDLLDNIPDSWKPSAEPSLPRGAAPGHQWLVNDGEHVRQHPHDVWAATNLTVQVIIGTTIHSEISPEWYKKRQNWTADRIREEVERSQIGIEGHTEKVLSIYNATLFGLASIISDIATVCPLYHMHKLIPYSKFYLVTQESDDAARNGLAYAGSDVQVFMGTYSYRTSPPQRRYITAIRNAFYRFTLTGKTPEYRMNIIGQDFYAHKMDPAELDTRCQLWKDIGFDKFAKID